MTGEWGGTRFCAFDKMKRVGYLFEQVIDPENLRLAFFKASRGKRHREDQRVWQSNLENEIVRLREGLMNLNYAVGNYRRFTIYEPKEREICAASFGERVLHHALMNVCEPYFDKWLIHDSYACRIGKGQKAALARARQFAHRYKWFLKCDFRKYFDSIPHDKLKSMLARRFKDPMILAWFRRVIDSYEKTPGRGLPIGNLTSQHLANLYLNSLDRFVSRGGCAGCAPLPCGYVRYMDDFIFWADDKDELVSLRKRVIAFARDELDLELKQTPFINRTSLGMDFLGMRVFPDEIHLSRESRVRYVRKVASYEEKAKRGEWDEEELQRRVTFLTAFTEQAHARRWRRHNLAIREEHRERTASIAAAAGTTTRRTAAPRIATGTSRATATTTSASASFAPQHRRTDICAVPANGRLPLSCGTNYEGCRDASSSVESCTAIVLSRGGQRCK